MKKGLLLGIALLVIASAVSAQAPPQGYFGLFYDEGGTTWCFTGAGMTTIYFLALPPADGLKCVELQVIIPAGFYLFGEVFNPDVKTPVMGTLATGMAACFNTCQQGEWTLVCSATFMVADMLPQTIVIEEMEGSPYPKILDCLDPANELEAYPYTYLYTNTDPCPGIANKESTWGAIKNMYE